MVSLNELIILYGTTEKYCNSHSRNSTIRTIYHLKSNFPSKFALKRYMIKFEDKIVFVAAGEIEAQ